MKLALVTDLHANRDAVEAVMAHSVAQGAQRYVFLGDFVGYGAEPAWVVDFVIDQVNQGAVAVMGNHDSAVVKGPTPTMVPQAREVVDWTHGQLDDRQLGFLAQLPMRKTVLVRGVQAETVATEGVEARGCGWGGVALIH